MISPTADWDNYYNYTDVAAYRLTSYLKEDNQPTAIAQAFVKTFRDLEQIHHELLRMLDINNATGKGLDAFGEIVGLSRAGMSDDDYREAIRAKRFSSAGSGTPEEIKSSLSNIVTGGRVTLVEHYPAAYVAYITNTRTNISQDLARQAYIASVAGVRPYVVTDCGKYLGNMFMLAGIEGALYNALGVEQDANTVIGASPASPVTTIGVNQIAGTLGGSILGGMQDAYAGAPSYRFSAALTDYQPNG